MNISLKYGVKVANIQVETLNFFVMCNLKINLCALIKYRSTPHNSNNYLVSCMRTGNIYTLKFNSKKCMKDKLTQKNCFFIYLKKFQKLTISK